MTQQPPVSVPTTVYYEYDADGWLIGWHVDPQRPRSTTVPPVGISPSEARWDGEKWVRDSKLVAQMNVASYIQSLWSMTSAYIARFVDQDAKSSLALRLADPDCDDACREKIRKVQQWINDIWSIYYKVKAQAKEGYFVRLDEHIESLPKCPYTIWEIIPPKKIS